MNEPSETPVSEHIEAFTKSIEALSQRHRQVALALCVARLARDTGLLPERPAPRPQAVWRIRQWLRVRATGHDRQTRTTVISRNAPSVIVINARHIPEDEGEGIDV